MDRRSLLVGALAGGWIATFALATPLSPFRTAASDPPPLGAPAATDPATPTSPGRTVTPLTGTPARGSPNPGTGTSGANNHAIALAGSVGSGESVVYYFDTDNQRLLVYQFLPGSQGGVRLLAARHFDFDLKLEQYRDLSFMTRDEMAEEYNRKFGKAAPGMGDSELPVKKVEIPGVK